MQTKLTNVLRFVSLGILLGTFMSAQSQSARLQAIHNSADPAAASVDVWLEVGGNATKLVADFGFREATPFIDAPADQPITLALAAPGSTSITDTLPGTTLNATLTSNMTYVVVASGNVGGGFAVNPDGRNSGFGYIIIANAREAAINSGEVDFAVVHGSTDAPTVDVYAQGIGTPLVDNAAYGDATAYLNVPAAAYYLDITAGNATAPLFTFKADLSGLAGGAAVVFASGYVTPGSNNNGEAFGLFAALANGTVVELEAPTARVQAVHNSADPAAASVDVYAQFGINTVKLIDDFDFRSATPFIDVPAQTPVTISIAPANSSSIADTLAGLSNTYTLTEGSSTVLMASGNVATGFAANPDGRNTGFGFIVIANAREAANNSGEVDFAVVHGSTDAPTVDVIANNSITLVDDAAYGDATNYLNVNAAAYTIALETSDNSVRLFEYDVDLSGLAGGAAVVFASGYVNSDSSNGGESFRLAAALADGTVILFDEVQEPNSVSEIVNNLSVYPNPANTSLQVVMNEVKGQADLRVMDIQGKIVLSEKVSHEGKISLNTSLLSNGAYMLFIQSEGKAYHVKFTVAH